MKYTDRELEDILNKLIASTRSPRGRFFSSIQLSATGEKAEFPQPPVVSDTHICGSGSSSFTLSIGMDSLSVHAAGNHTDC